MENRLKIWECPIQLGTLDIINVFFQDFKHFLEPVINIIVGLSARAHNPPRFEDQKDNGILGGAQDEAREDGFLVRSMLAELGVESLQVNFLVGLQLHMRYNVLNHTRSHLKPIPAWLSCQKIINNNVCYLCN
jgi:hypothetical protein